MRARLLRFALALLAVVGSAGVPSASAQTAPVPGPCHRFLQPTGAIGLICVPVQGWNGDLIVFAHGYIAFNQPLDLQHLTLPGGGDVPTLAQTLGFAFAASSFRQNGLAVLEGADDLRALVQAFRVAVRPPAHTYAVGVSQGGLIATLLTEQSPDLVSGGLALCAPIGDFRAQGDYLGDFRVLFDYFFPGVLPGSPIAVPQSLIDGWATTYQPAVQRALATNPSAARQLIATSKAAIDPGDPASLERTVTGLLWYSTFATNDAMAKLGGNPFGNTGRFYFGSSNDLLLNLGVQRYSANPTALANLGRYQTTGRLRVPLVTAHTTGDEIVPFWHEIAYAARVRTSERGRWTPLPIFRYGHCNFTAAELLAGLGLLAYQVTGQESAATAPRASAERVGRDFARAAQATRPR
jgi:pimeloyl-ACP methyl ester carboxylesterase